ncbi:MAG: hypothetical protein KC420_18890, partial [Myxococcales bacterium]|nr:hypothetical protein [Myxococcales bacterium]
IVRMIVAEIVHTLLAVAVYETDVVHVAEDLAGDPEFGYAVFPVISWVLFAVAGGLGSGSLGRGLAMLVYGILAGLAVVFGYQVTNDPWALHALAWFIIGWGYMRTREGEAPFVRAAITTLGVFVIANALEASAFADGAVVVFGAFWLAHYFWERQESAAKKG